MSSPPVTSSTVQRYGTAKELTGADVKTCKAALTGIYKLVPGVNDLHDFQWSVDASALECRYPKLQVRQWCYAGDLRREEMVVGPFVAHGDVQPSLTWSRISAVALAKTRSAILWRCMGGGYRWRVDWRYFHLLLHCS